MNDVLQHSLHTAASSGLLGALAIFCANYLIVLAALGLAAVAWVNRERVTRQYVARALISGGVSLVLIKVFGHIVHDPRPYLVEHYTPLAHTAVLALFTGWAAWLSRRSVPYFAAALVAVLLGRLPAPWQQPVLPERFGKPV